MPARPRGASIAPRVSSPMAEVNAQVARMRAMQGQGSWIGQAARAIQGSGNALVRAGQAAAARIPTLSAPPQAAGAAARGSRGVASVLGRVAANPRILANPYTAAAAGTLALGAWAASAAGGGGQQGRRSGGGQYFGPGYMPDAAIFPRGRGLVGGVNAGANSAADWSGGATPVANTTPVGYGAPPVVGAPASRAYRERANEMLQNAGVQQPLPPMEDLRPYWAQNPEIAQAAKDGPRSTEVGYSDRADIRAWIEANKNAQKGADGKNIVDRFLEQQQRRGLIREQPESVDSYTPIFTQRQLADVDAVQSPAFSKGRDQILAMRDPMVTPPNVDQSWSAGFQKGDPVDWEAAMGASLAVPGGPAAQRREDLNRVLDMPGALVSESPSVDQRWAAGFTQDSPTNWDAAVNTKLNVPTVMGNAMQPGTTLTTSQPSSNVNWNAAMNTDLGYSQGITGNEMELGERFNNPDEQRRRLAAGFLGNRIEGLKRFFPGA